MSTKSDLKENILAAKVEVALNWAMANRGPVLTGAAIAVIALLIGSVIMLRGNEKRDEQLTRLAVAQSFIGQHQYDRAAQILQDLKPDVTDNIIAVQLAYYQGVSAIGMKKFDEAEKYFSEAVDRANGSPVKPLALSNLGYAQEQKKDYTAAAATYGRFMTEFGEHFLAPRVQLELGRSLAGAGKIDEAKKALGQLIDLYPTSHWAENARSIMDKFKSR